MPNYQDPRMPPEVRAYERAQELERDGQYETAIMLLAGTAMANPNIAAIHNRLGVLVAIHRRDYRAAADHIARAIELEPDCQPYRDNHRKMLEKLEQQPGTQRPR